MRYGSGSSTPMSSGPPERFATRAIGLARICRKTDTRICALPDARTVTPAQQWGMRILVVDDSATLRQFIAVVLRRAGHTIESVATAPEAIHKFETDTYDLVISDLWLGNAVDGLLLAHAVRQARPDVRFILAIGAVGELSAEERAEWGVDAILRKPFTLAQLRDVVAEVSKTPCPPTG